MLLRRERPGMKMALINSAFASRLTDVIIIWGALTTTIGTEITSYDEQWSDNKLNDADYYDGEVDEWQPAPRVWLRGGITQEQLIMYISSAPGELMSRIRSWTRHCCAPTDVGGNLTFILQMSVFNEPSKNYSMIINIIIHGSNII